MMLNRYLILSLLLLFSVSLTWAGQIVLTDISISKTDSSFILEVEVQNNSLSPLKISLWADIYDNTGKYRARIKSIGQQIAGLGQTSYQFYLSNLDSGVYKALLVGQYIPEEIEDGRRASTLLMEYIAPFELSANPNTNFVIKDEIDAPNSTTQPEWIPEESVVANQFVSKAAIELDYSSETTAETKKVDTTITEKLLDRVDGIEEECVYYTVRSGDWLSKLAKIFYGDKTKFMRIFDANKNLLSDPDILTVGQKIKIPFADHDYLTYRVKSGDWLSSIAKEFYGDHFKSTKILSANSQNVKNPNHIIPGQILKIPSLKSDLLETHGLQEERTPGDFWKEYSEETLLKSRGE